MKFASFRYEYSGNLGDQIQTIAAERHLPRVDERIDRDSMAMFEAEEPHIVILNGWFSHRPESCFPPGRAIVPIFIGFHLSDSRGSRARPFILAGPSLAYLKAHEPIGCRDEGTRLMLEEVGIEAYTSLCLTITFPTRDATPNPGAVMIVDGDGLPIPASIRKHAISVSQSVDDGLSDEVKIELAAELLERYQREARLVITTKLHCALPCLGMGIPVVFFGDPDDYRLGPLIELGLPIYKHRTPRPNRLHRIWQTRAVREVWSRLQAGNVNWNPRPLDIDRQKADLVARVRLELLQAEAHASQPAADSEPPTSP